MFTESGKMLIGANEQFYKPNNIGGRSAVHARILIFNENPIKDSSPACNPATFEAGECDADDAIGQARFDKLATVGDENPVSYNEILEGLYSLDDFDLVAVPSSVEGEDPTELIMGVSSVTNEVYFWNNWLVKSADGYPKSARAVDPAAAPHPSTGQLMPDLKGLCSIRISLESTNVYVGDCGGNRVYEIQAADYVTGTAQ